MIKQANKKLNNLYIFYRLCGAMEWDQDGDYLAMITPNSNSVLLWECHANKRVNIETGLREPPSCLAWAYGEPLLAVGTQKGNLALYNHHTTKYDIFLSIINKLQQLHT